MRIEARSEGSAADAEEEPDTIRGTRGGMNIRKEAWYGEQVRCNSY
jgi:hypothetical protein